jgi:hypothetical protein
MLSSRMLTYAHVCSRMLTYAHVCSRMLTYAGSVLQVRGRLHSELTYAHVCSRMLTYADSVLQVKERLDAELAAIERERALVRAQVHLLYTIRASAYVSIRQHTSAYVSSACSRPLTCNTEPAYVSIRIYSIRASTFNPLALVFADVC